MRTFNIISRSVRERGRKTLQYNKNFNCSKPKERGVKKSTRKIECDTCGQRKTLQKVADGMWWRDRCGKVTERKLASRRKTR